MTALRTIMTREQLTDLAQELGVRKSWHEPDEQGVDAIVKGNDFDNAGFWPSDRGIAYADGSKTLVEKHVIIKKDGEPVAAVNLATLFAFATGYEGMR